MKLRLTKFLVASILAAQSCAPTSAAAYEERTENNVKYTLTENGDGSYHATAKINSGSYLDKTGGTHVAINGELTVDTTPVKGVTITMDTDRTIGMLSAGSWGATPISGSVHMNINAGYVGSIYGGNHLDTELTSSYSEASIESITINLGGNASANWITGGSCISYGNGSPNADFIRKYATSGDIAVTISDNASVTYVYNVFYDYEKANGSSTIEINGGSVNTALANVSGTVTEDASVTINGGSVQTVSAGYDGQVGGNAEVTVNGGEVTNVYAVASGTVEQSASVTTNGGEVGIIYATTGGTVKGNASVTTNDGSVSYVIGLASGTVEGDTAITTNGGKVDNIYGLNGGTVKGSVRISTNGGNIGEANGVYGGTVKEDVIVTTTNGTINKQYGVHYGTVEGNIAVTTKGGSIDTLCGLWDGSVEGDITVTTDGGTINSLTGALGGNVGGNVTVTTNEGTLGGSTASVGANVNGDVNYIINGGTSGNIFGVYRGTVEGNATIIMNGGEVNDIIGVASDAYGVGNVKGNAAVYLLAGKVNGTVWGVCEDARASSSTLYIGSANAPYHGTVQEINYFDHVVIAPGSSITTTSGNLFSVTTHNYNVSQKNLTTPVVKTAGNVAVEKPITLNLNVPNTLPSGRYMLIDATKGSVDTTRWSSKNVTINSTTAYQSGSSLHVDFEDLEWSGNVLYLYLLKDESKNLFSNNWGVFKSSQAFVNTLWSNHANRTLLHRRASSTENNGIVAPCDNTGATMAWAAMYGQNARISGIGADYSLYGAVLGIEHHRPSGRKIGVAFGYDWGKVSPFHYARIDQDAVHAALYGRAAEWKVHQNGAIAVDWSTAIGRTHAETKTETSDWEQNHMQVNARLSYLHMLNHDVTASVFTGLQYFATEDAEVDQIGISSMQNLRTEIGLGIHAKVAPKTNLWSEISLFNDAMRHNPYIFVADKQYEGTNPGRLGGRVNIGVSHQLNNSWTIQGSYSFEAADNNKEHNINIGAGYQF